MSSELDMSDSSLKETSKKNFSSLEDLKKTTPFIDNDQKENKMSINDVGDNEIEDNDDYKININRENINMNLPKYSFIQFFLNNLYCSCCNQFKQQELLHICNRIILKYMSIDSILYNQIKLENLFKDYKWNNPSLNNMENNELLLKLKKLI